MVSYLPHVAEEIRAIENPAVRSFVLDVLRNGSFLKLKQHVGDGRYKTVLKVGVEIFFELEGSNALVVGIRSLY